MSTQSIDISGSILMINQEPKKETSKQPVVTYACRRCGRKGHFSISCKIKTDIHGNDIDSDDGYNSSEYR